MRKSIALLRFRWNDLKNARCLWDDTKFNQLFISQTFRWGIAGFWRQCSCETIDLSGSRIFPWTVFDQNLFKAGGGYHDYKTFDLLQAAIWKMESLGHDLTPFDVIVVVMPNEGTGWGDGGQATSGMVLKNGKKVSGTILSDGKSHSVIAHEVGHALGFEHSYGFVPDQLGRFIRSYKDSYCIMSAKDWNGKSPSFRYTNSLSGYIDFGDAYGDEMGPAPSCAILYHYNPDFRNSGMVHDLSPAFRQSAVHIRLFASHLGKMQTPILINVPVINNGTDPFEKRMLIELRSGTGIDAGLSDMAAPDNGNPANPAIVVHSIRTHAELVPGWGNKEMVVLEGFLPLYSEPGADISFYGARDLGIKLLSVAPDRSFADLLIGNEVFGKQKSVTIQAEPQLYERENDGSGGFIIDEADNVVIPPNCGTGKFKYKLYYQKGTTTFTALANGYIKTEFVWSINGIAIPLQNGEPIPAGVVFIPVITETVEPGKIIVTNKMIRVFFKQENNKISVTTHGDDGNFDMTVGVTSFEKDPAFNTVTGDPRTAYSNARIEGMHIIFGDDYQKAVNSCWAAFFANLPVAPMKRRGIKSDFEIAKFLGTRFDHSGIILRKDIEASRSFITKISSELPGMAKQLKSAFDIIINQKNNLKG